MKCKGIWLSGLLGIVLAAPMSVALADGDGPPPSYREASSAEVAIEAIDTMITWAKSELEEHVGEGLYKGRDEDKALV
ncbi:MAG: hypothetical protein LBV36_05780, partial [Chromatiales bacterium]|nr:hypothetical protein [Chromatiales bacterium]